MKIIFLPVAALFVVLFLIFSGGGPNPTAVGYGETGGNPTSEGYSETGVDVLGPTAVGYGESVVR